MLRRAGRCQIAERAAEGQAKLLGLVSNHFKFKALFTFQDLVSDLTNII
jgi:hypothetical protein